MFNEIIDIIKANQKFLITSHKSPDGDALGSSVALGLALEKLQKNVMYNLDPSLGENIEFLTQLTQVTPGEMNDQYDVIICLDCSDINHLYAPNTLKHGMQVLNIDHHINNQNYGSVNLVDAHAAATGEIIYSLIKQLEIELDKNIAVALYTAIVTDTGGFKYSNVTSNTHFITSELLQFPINSWKINKRLFDEHRKEKILLIGKAINNLKIHLNGKLAIIKIDLDDLQKTGATSEDTEGIINYGRDITGVEVAVLIKEHEAGEYRVSFRSNEYVDVGEIALSLGGGGHIRASGCTMRGSMDSIVQKLKELISNKLWHGDKNEWNIKHIKATRDDIP